MIYIAQGYVSIDARGAELTWDPPTDADLNGFEVMKLERDQWVKLHQGILSRTTTKFRTGELRHGVHTFGVVAVDKAGNRSELAQVTVRR